VDLDALLTEYGVTSESQRDRLQALNRGAKEPGWWDAYKNDVSAEYLSYVGFEAGAAVIRQFQMGFIPGLLQTDAPMFCQGFSLARIRRVCFLLMGGHDREGPLLAEGRLLSGHEVSSWRWARGGRRIDRRPAPVAAAD